MTLGYIYLKLKSTLKDPFSPIKKTLRRIKLKHKDFTIISNNCWAGFIYQYYGLPYKTPFIGLYLFADDYIKLLDNLKYYLAKPLTELTPERSKYKEMLIKRGHLNKFPIGIIDNDIEIHFMHYKNFIEAKNIWDRRLMRINYKKLIVKFSDNDLCSDDHILMFSNLDFPNKLCFTSKKFENLENVIQLKEFENSKTVKDEWEYHENYLNLTEFINNIQ